MEVVRGVSELARATAPSSVTIGFFDGVHLGHRRVIGRTVDAARDRGLSSVAVTFDRHPREVFSPGREPRLLTTLERKIELIATTGVDRLVVLEFTDEFSRWTAEEFVDRILADGLAARHVVVGDNFTFGFRAEGTVPVLRGTGAERGFDVEGIGLMMLGVRVVSSTSIRQSLTEGDLTWPEEALGRRFVLDGHVVRGAGRGTGLGWPTANLQTLPRLLLPGEGVYAGRALHRDSGYRAAINVGTNPTFGQEPVHLEAFLLDFSGDLVGEPLAIEFWERLRDEVRFDSIEELSRQIEADVERTREVVSL
ncbi:MAG TPA: bifunctional riboflavin kinase/FAD synthetase, partial [Actinomycetota bacterium]